MKMKTVLRSLICAPVLLMSTALFAAETPRIGLVDVQNAILQTNEGKAQREKIEKEFNEKRRELTDQEKQLKKMSDDFLAQQAVLSESDKATKQKEFQAKLQKYQQDQASFDQEARQKESMALQTIFQNMQKEIAKISQQKNLDMVFDKSAGVLLYAVNPTDITADVVKLYNTDFKVKNDTKS